MIDSDSENKCDIYGALDDMLRTYDIEYYAAVPFSECRIINSRRIQNIGFEPRGVLVFLVPYLVRGDGIRNISLYAVSRDYHIYFDMLFRELANVSDGMFMRINMRINMHGFADASPVDEVNLAASAGLGVIGDNGLLINEKYGSFVFIGELLTDIAPQKAEMSAPGSCTHCGRCSALCPTASVKGDKKGCLSALTQSKSALAPETVSLMKTYNTAWGCDICQLECEMNQNVCETPIGWFRENRIARLNGDILDAMDETEFNGRAYSWRGRNVIARNIAAINGKNEYQ